MPVDCSKIDWIDSIICQSVPDMRNQAGSVQWMYIWDDKVGGWGRDSWHCTTEGILTKHSEQTSGRILARVTTCRSLPVLRSPGTLTQHSQMLYISTPTRFGHSKFQTPTQLDLRSTPYTGIWHFPLDIPPHTKINRWTFSLIYFSFISNNWYPLIHLLQFLQYDITYSYSNEK